MTIVYKNNKEIIIEELAEAVHNSWSGWMEYLFDKSKQNKDGSVTISKSSVDGWKRQMKTPYKELSEKEKESDRIEAIKYYDIIEGRTGI